MDSFGTPNSRPFGICIFYLFGTYIYVWFSRFEYYVVVWCIFSHFGTSYLGKSGNPARSPLLAACNKRRCTERRI
jgi:hypothetical protein